jgi:hypothetical protein
VVLPYLASRDYRYEARRGKDPNFLSQLEYKTEIAIATYLLVGLKTGVYKIVKIIIKV